MGNVGNFGSDSDGMWVTQSTVQGRNASRRNDECESTDAEPSGGPSCSSDEGSVMELERRGRVIRVQTVVTRRAE